MLIYIILCLFDAFQLLIVLGFYFQTDRGKKLPHRKNNGTYVDPEADKDYKNKPKSAAEKEDEKDHAERERKIEDEEAKKRGENRE